MKKQILLLAMFLLGFLRGYSGITYNEFNQSFTLTSGGTSSNALDLDINKDGVNDYYIRYDYDISLGGEFIHLVPYGLNEILLSSTQNTYGVNYISMVSPLFQIGSSAGTGTSWGTVDTRGPLFEDYALPNLATNKNQLVGIRLNTPSGYQYGWINIVLTSTYPQTLTVVDFAFESTVNTSIAAGQKLTTTNSSVVITPGQNLTVSIPTSLSFCDNTLVFSLDKTPDKDMVVDLGNYINVNGQKMLEFYDNLNNPITSLVFAAGNTTLSKTIKFSAFKYYDNTTSSNSWAYSFNFTTSYNGTYMVQNLTPPAISGNPFVQFVYDGSSSLNLNSLQVTGGNVYQRTYSIVQTSGGSYTGKLAFTELLAKSIKINKVQLVQGTTVLYEITTTPSNISQVTNYPAGQIQQFKYSYEFNIPASLSGNFHLVEYIEPIICQAPSGDLSYVKSQLDISYSCNTQGSAANIITNIPIESTVELQIINPNFWASIEMPTPFDVCFYGKRTTTIHYNNTNTTTGVTGAGIMSELFYYGFNGDVLNTNGSYNYTPSGELVTSVVPVSSLVINSYGNSYSIDYSKSKFIKGQDIINANVYSNANALINPSADYVKVLILKTTGTFLVPANTADFLTIKYDAIDLCPRVFANGFLGGGLFCPFSFHAYDGTSSNEYKYNFLKNTCGDIMHEQWSFANNIGCGYCFKPYEAFQYNKHTAEKVGGVSVMAACKIRPDYGVTCSNAELNNSSNPGADFTENFTIKYTGYYGGISQDPIKILSLNDLSYTVELETENGLIPAPNGTISSPNYNGYLKWVSGSHVLVPTNSILLPPSVPNPFNKRVIQYTFDLSNYPTLLSDVTYFTNGAFDINNFLRLTNFYFDLSGICSERVEDRLSNYSLRVYENVNKSCPNCALPISRFDGTVLLTCPGCINPGIETYVFNLQRVVDNTSKIDSDDDGFPDSGTNGLPDNGRLLNRAVTGDIINANTLSNFFAGTDITYLNTGNSANDLLSYNGGADYLKYMYRVDGFTPSVAKGLEVVPGSLSFSMQRNGILYNLGNLDGKINVYSDPANGKFTFEIYFQDVLDAMVGKGIPNGTIAFLGKDLYFINAQYRLKGGFDFEANYFSAYHTKNKEYIDQVSTNVSLTLDRKCGTGVCSIPSELADQLPMADLTTGADAGKYMYRCYGTAKSFTFYDRSMYITGYDEFTNDNAYLNNTCTKIPRVEVTSFTGKGSELWFYNWPEKIFPYEYRQLRVAKDIKIEIPPGFNFTQGKIINLLRPSIDYSDREEQTMVLNVNYTVVNQGGRKYLVVNPKFNSKLNASKKSGSSSLVDEFFVPSDVVFLMVLPEFAPTCDAKMYNFYKKSNSLTDQQVLTAVQNHYNANNPKGIHPAYYSPLFTGPSDPIASNTYIADPITAELSYFRTSDVPLSFPYPLTGNDNIQFAINSGLASVTNNVFLFNFIQPNQVSATNFFTSQFNNTLEVTFNNPQDLDNILLAFNSTNLKVNDFKVDGSATGVSVNANGVALIDHLATGSHKLTFTIQLNNCSLSNLQLLYGFNCSSIDLSTITLANFNSNVCNPNFVSINVEMTTSTLALNSTTNNISCSLGLTHLDYENKLVIGVGSVNNMKVRHKILQGASYQSGSALVYLNGTLSPLTLTPSTVTIGSVSYLEFDLTALATELPAGAEVRLVSTYELTCKYLNEPMVALALATSYCGASVNTNPVNTTVDLTNACPIMTASINTPADICLNQSALLSATVLGGVPSLTYQWYNAATNTAIATATSSTYNVVGAAAGTYTYYVIVKDSKGCETKSNTVNLTVKPLPIIDAGSDVEICEGASAVLTAGGVVSNSWYYLDALSNKVYFSGNPVSVSPTTTTRYYLEGTGSNGCTNLDDVLVTVNKKPILSVSGNVLGCSLTDPKCADILFNTTSGTPTYTYVVTNSDGTVVYNGSTNTVSLCQDSYSATVTDSKGCSNTATFKVERIADYKIGDVEWVCGTTSKRICIPLIALTNGDSRNIRGLDFCLKYDPTILSFPTNSFGVPTVNPTDLGPVTTDLSKIGTTLNAEYSVNIEKISATEANLHVSIYYLGGAPVSAHFTGTGTVVCLPFDVIGSPVVGTISTLEMCNIIDITATPPVSRYELDEAYTLTESQRCYEKGSFNVVYSSFYTAQLFKANDVLMQRSSIPALSCNVWRNNFTLSISADPFYMAGNSGTNVYATDANCGSPGTAVTLSNNGTFKLPVNTSNKVLIDRDVIGGINRFSKYVNGYDTYLMNRITTLNAKSENPNPALLPSPAQMLAADVNMNDRVRSNDITLVQQRFVGNIIDYDQVNGGKVDWRFFPQSMLTQPSFIRSASYPNPDLNNLDNYWRDNVPDLAACFSPKQQCANEKEKVYGVLLGDVGHYYASGCNYTTVVSSNGAGVPSVYPRGGDPRVKMGEKESDPLVATINFKGLRSVNQEFEVPIEIAVDSMPVYSIDVIVDYDSTIISVNDIRTTPHTNDGQVSMTWNNYQNNQLRLTSYATGDTINSHGKVYYITMSNRSTTPITEKVFRNGTILINGIEYPLPAVRKSPYNYTTFLADIALEIKPSVVTGTSEILYRFTEESDKNSLVITNALGQQVSTLECKGNNNSITINSENFAAGVYFCTMIDSVSGQKITKKFVVVR